MNIRKKLLVFFVALGLSLNWFCVNLLVPRVAMAMPADTVNSGHTILTSHTGEMNDRASMATTEVGVDCGKMNLNAGLNCCLSPVNHGTEKSIEFKLPLKTHHPIKGLAVKSEVADGLKFFANNHFRHSYHYGGILSLNFVGQTVKRE